MIAGVLGLLLVGRLPLWITAVAIVRDLFLLVRGGVFAALPEARGRDTDLEKWRRPSPFHRISPGFSLYTFPLIPGLGVCDIAWLPGFNGEFLSRGAFGLCMSALLSLSSRRAWSTAVSRGVAALKEARCERAAISCD